ncbi:MAG: transposase [Lewinellaceae bacterium]|nr:transposase [Lewinellaceae bacterium]
MDETRLRVLEDGGKGALGVSVGGCLALCITCPSSFTKKAGSRSTEKIPGTFCGRAAMRRLQRVQNPDKKLADITLMNCMAPHIRREFFEAQGTDAERTQTALTMIKILYLVEEKARLAGAERRTTPGVAPQRIKARLRYPLPVAPNRIQPGYSSSSIGKAIQYALNRWKNMATGFYRR